MNGERYDRLSVCVASQTLRARLDGHEVKRYAVSTGRAGTGQLKDSEQTPLGAHIVRVKIGANAPRGAVFVRRRRTGEIWSPQLHAAHPGRDWVLTRILWLAGLERAVNRYGNVDSLRRFIYIHGTPDSEPLGEPRSHGCIRMGSDDIIELFDRVPRGVPIDICEEIGE